MKISKISFTFLISFNIVSFILMEIVLKTQ